MRRQTTYRPPPGRPGWSSPPGEELELLYLAWGWRKYGEDPQGMAIRDGWLYFMPRKGVALLRMAQRTLPLQEGEMIILHPDCACGFDAPSGSVIEVCTWIWRSPSRWTALRSPAGGYLKLTLSDENLVRLRDLHEQARLEIQTSDENTQAALGLLRDQMDLILVRSASGRPQPATDSQRVELACRWIELHLEIHNPLEGLCDYLQLSPSTLNRMFQRRLQMSVRTFAKQARLRRAREMVEGQGLSIKEAAFALGYRFANDLSRAARQARP